MKFLKDNIVAILLIALTVLIVLQIQSWFSNAPKLQDHSKEIEQVREERDYYRSKYDSVIATARERDTVLIQQYIQTNDKIKNVRPVVIDYSKEQLRAEIRRYALPPGE